MKFLRWVIMTRRRYDQTITDISRGSFRLGKALGESDAGGNGTVIISWRVQNELGELLKKGM